MVKRATIRFFISTTVTHNRPLKQLDVTTAFLQGKLNDEVYMSQPIDFQEKKTTAVCRDVKMGYPSPFKPCPFGPAPFTAR